MVAKQTFGGHRANKVCLQGATDEALGIPEAIYNEYALRGLKPGDWLPLPTNGEKPPYAQYTDARGFVFDWGQVMVRHVDNKSLWDFILAEMLTAYHIEGLSLWALQRDCLHCLELTLSALIDYEPLASSLDLSGFRITPGTAISAFTVSCHFSQTDKTLAWLDGEFMPQHLPLLFGYCGKALQRRIDNADVF